MKDRSKAKEHMAVWFGYPDVEELNRKSQASLNSHLGIEMIEVTDDALKGRMPIDHRTIQPAGVLHGGASMAFAETLASWAGYLAVDRSKYHVVGQEINANHVRPGVGVYVYGEATPANIGRRAHVWQVRITNEQGKLVCISRCTLAVIEVASAYARPEHRG